MQTPVVVVGGGGGIPYRSDGIPYRSDGMLIVSLRGVNCRFWSHLKVVSFSLSQTHIGLPFKFPTRIPVTFI